LCLLLLLGLALLPLLLPALLLLLPPLLKLLLLLLQFLVALCLESSTRGIGLCCYVLRALEQHRLLCLQVVMQMLQFTATDAATYIAAQQGRSVSTAWQASAVC
jgi:hypothetical protein